MTKIKFTTDDEMAKFYEPLFFLIDLICVREGVPIVDLMLPRTNYKYTQILYLAMCLSNEYFNHRVGKANKLYSLEEIGWFYAKSHSLVATATRRANNWAEIYREFRIKKKFYEIKLNEKFIPA